MKSLRRFLILVLFMFWQGGFTFYTAVVVPIGTDVLGSALDQGWITRRVTVHLNQASAVALAVLAWDICVEADPVSRRRRLRWLVWALLAAALVALIWIHAQLNALMDPDLSRLLNRSAFRTLHRLYLWTSTFQWGCSLVAVFLMLRAWQAADERTHNAETIPVKQGLP
jgi:hypothetical protein